MIKPAFVFEGAQQFSKGDLAFAAHDEIHTARIARRISLCRKAGVVAADRHSDIGLEDADEINDLLCGLALKGHHRQADDIRLMFAHQALDGFAHAVLRQNQIGDGDAMLRIKVAGKRGERAVRHAYGDRGHVLE